MVELGSKKNTNTLDTTGFAQKRNITLDDVKLAVETAGDINCYMYDMQPEYTILFRCVEKEFDSGIIWLLTNGAEVNTDVFALNPDRGSIHEHLLTAAYEQIVDASPTAATRYLNWLLDYGLSVEFEIATPSLYDASIEETDTDIDEDEDDYRFRLEWEDDDDYDDDGYRIVPYAISNLFHLNETLNWKEHSGDFRTDMASNIYRILTTKKHRLEDYPLQLPVDLNWNQPWDYILQLLGTSEHPLTPEFFITVVTDHYGIDFSKISEQFKESCLIFGNYAAKYYTHASYYLILADYFNIPFPVRLGEYGLYHIRRSS